MSIELGRVCEKGSEGHHGREKVHEGHHGRQTIENKKAPNQADNFVNFSVMLLNKNQLFGSSARSDLQAISFNNFFHLYLGCVEQH